MAVDKLRASVKQADEVSRLLENNYLRAAWVATEKQILQMWRDSKSDEQDKREELYREYHGLQAVKARLQRVVNEGTKAVHELARAEKQSGKRSA